MRVDPFFVPGCRLGALAVCLLLPLAARAAVSATASAITATAGSTGTFEEYITVPVDVTDETVMAYALTLTATAVTGSGLTFTGVSTATTPDAYLFLGMSDVATNGTAYTASVFPNLSFTVGDKDTSSAGVALVSGDLYGLVEVSYMVAANATPGIYTITPTTTLTETGGLGTGDTPTTFTILPAPEPSTWAMLAGGGLMLGGFALRRRRALRG